MKKSLATLGLLMAFCQPVFAECCNPCYTGAACPAQPCAPYTSCVPFGPNVKVTPIAKTNLQACVPTYDPCNPCAAGGAASVNIAAFGVDQEYGKYCCEKKNFWLKFFGFGDN